jgi:uncharacterized Zn finger protein
MSRWRCVWSPRAPAAICGCCARRLIAVFAPGGFSATGKASSGPALRLADTRETHHPADSLAVYPRVVDEILQTTDRRAYASAGRILKRARATAAAANQLPVFTEHMARLREQHRRRPTLIAMLDKASLR